MNCQDCNNKLLEKIDEVYCPRCGLVLEDNPLYFGIDWDNWEGEFEDSRAGKPARYVDGDVSKTNPTIF